MKRILLCLLLFGLSSISLHSMEQKKLTAEEVQAEYNWMFLCVYITESLEIEALSLEIEALSLEIEAFERAFKFCNVDVNRRAKSGRSLLSIAAMVGNCDVCKFLIEHGANVGLVNETGFETALIEAAQKDLETVKVLLTTIPPKVSLSIEKQKYTMGSFPTTELRFTQSAHLQIIQKLVDSLVIDQMSRIEKIIKYKDKNGVTALEWAQKLNKPDIAEFLDIDKPDARKNLMKLLDAQTKRILLN